VTSGTAYAAVVRRNGELVAGRVRRRGGARSARRRHGQGRWHCGLQGGWAPARSADQAYATTADSSRTCADGGPAARLIAASWARRPGPRCRNGLALHALVTEQTDNSGPPAPRGRLPAPGDQSGRRAGRGRLADSRSTRRPVVPAIMTVLFAAETLYLTWCTRRPAGRVPTGRPPSGLGRACTPPNRSGTGRALAEQVDQIPTEVPDVSSTTWFGGIAWMRDRVPNDAVFESLNEGQAPRGNSKDGVPITQVWRGPVCRRATSRYVKVCVNLTCGRRPSPREASASAATVTEGFRDRHVALHVDRGRSPRRAQPSDLGDPAGGRAVERLDPQRVGGGRGRAGQ